MRNLLAANEKISHEKPKPIKQRQPQKQSKETASLKRPKRNPTGKGSRRETDTPTTTYGTSIKPLWGRAIIESAKLPRSG